MKEQSAWNKAWKNTAYTKNTYERTLSTQSTLMKEHCLHKVHLWKNTAYTKNTYERTLPTQSTLMKEHCLHKEHSRKNTTFAEHYVYRWTHNRKGL